MRPAAKAEAAEAKAKAGSDAWGRAGSRRARPMRRNAAVMVSNARTAAAAAEATRRGGRRRETRRGSGGVSDGAGVLDDGVADGVDPLLLFLRVGDEVHGLRWGRELEGELAVQCVLGAIDNEAVGDGNDTAGHRHARDARVLEPDEPPHRRPPPAPPRRRPPPAPPHRCALLRIHRERERER